MKSNMVMIVMVVVVMVGELVAVRVLCAQTLGLLLGDESELPSQGMNGRS
jgi:hypothetical protein